MKWILDTNAISRYLAGRHPALTAKVHSVRRKDLVLCSIVRAELLYGAWKSPDPTASLARLKPIFEDLETLAFDDAAAHEFGKLHADLSQRGCRIEPNDTLIASIALANNLTLITNNTREFSRVPGLRIEDWQS